MKREVGLDLSVARMKKEMGLDYLMREYILSPLEQNK